MLAGDAAIPLELNLDSLTPSQVLNNTSVSEYLSVEANRLTQSSEQINHDMATGFFITVVRLFQQRVIEESLWQLSVP